jgi:hypothetical protein
MLMRTYSELNALVGASGGPTRPLENRGEPAGGAHTY